MMLYLCSLTLHGNVFFASREMGTLYETEKYLHNWALSYAFFGATHIPIPYRLQGENAQRPGYLEIDHEQNLLLLNKSGIYVFPAFPVKSSYQISTFKTSHAAYHQQTQKFGGRGVDRNYPTNYGQVKELAVGSRYRTYIFAPETVRIPGWIRLGKWATKIQVIAKPVPATEIKAKAGEFVCEHPLNPIDLPSSTQLLLYNRIVMPPVSLLSQSQLLGDYWEITKPSRWAESSEWSELKDLPDRVCLPRGMGYGANVITAAS